MIEDWLKVWKRLWKHGAVIERLDRELRKVVKEMSDLSKQQDRLDADIPVLQKQEADEAAQVAAGQKSISDAQSALNDMKAQRDALQSSDAAAAARLTGQIDALEKLITVAQAPAPQPAPAPNPAPVPVPAPAPATP